MTRRKACDGHFLDVCDVPGADDDSPGAWVGLERVDGQLDLVDFSALAIWPVAPLMTVDGPELSVRGSEFVVRLDALNERLQASAPFFAAGRRHRLPGRL